MNEFELTERVVGGAASAAADSSSSSSSLVWEKYRDLQCRKFALTVDNTLTDGRVITKVVNHCGFFHIFLFLLSRRIDNRSEGTEFYLDRWYCVREYMEECVFSVCVCVWNTSVDRE